MFEAILTLYVIKQYCQLRIKINLAGGSQKPIMDFSGHRKILHSCAHFHARKRKENLLAQIWFDVMISLPLFPPPAPAPSHKAPFLIISRISTLLTLHYCHTPRDTVSFWVRAQSSPVGFFLRHPEVLYLFGSTWTFPLHIPIFRFSLNPYPLFYLLYYFCQKSNMIFSSFLPGEPKMDSSQKIVILSFSFYTSTTEMYKESRKNPEWPTVLLCFFNPEKGGIEDPGWLNRWSTRLLILGL